MEVTDRVKQLVGDVGEAAKKGASAVQTTLEHARLRRKADAAAKRLGYLVHRERTGGPRAGAEADALSSEIADAEARLAPDETAEPAMTEEPSAPPADVKAPTTPRAEAKGPTMPPPAPEQSPEEAAGE